MHLPLDWPRINQFPEYFTVEKDKTIQFETDNNHERSGNERRKSDGWLFCKDQKRRDNKNNNQIRD